MRNKTKIFRLTDLQLEQLEQHLQKENTNFTDFIHSLIEREVMQDAITVQQTQDEIKPTRTKIKTVVGFIHPDIYFDDVSFCIRCRDDFFFINH